MKDGWLWLSILKTTAAFSPGPQMTRGPSVGSFLRWTFDDLYEQCSLHIAEKTPSSVRLGVRPRIASQRANSSAESPISAASDAVTLEPELTAARSPVRRKALARQCSPAAGRSNFRGAASAPAPCGSR